MSTFIFKKCDSVSLSLLAENTARGAGILGEHGLSWCLQYSGKQVLFDLGQGMTLRANAAQMGVALEVTDAVVFSHGHYDHVRGWRQVADSLREVPIFLHPHSLHAKFQKRADGRMDSAGDKAFASAMARSSGRVCALEEPCEVVPGIWMTGEVPRCHQIEDTGGAFYCGDDASRRDELLDDQSLFFRTDAGVVVVLGCAHSGVMNTLEHVCALTGERIHAVVGGMHLLHADEARMRFTVEGLRRIAPDWLAPNHCTGDAAVAQLWQAFPGQVFEMHAGQVVIFPKKIPQPEALHHG